MIIRRSRSVPNAYSYAVAMSSPNAFARLWVPKTRSGRTDDEVRREWDVTAGCQCAELGDARRVFVQRPVRPNAIIVACIGAQHAPQMPLANDNDVVQAFPANGPNQSFSKTVLPRRPRRDWLVPNAHCAH